MVVPVPDRLVDSAAVFVAAVHVGPQIGPSVRSATGTGWGATPALYNRRRPRLEAERGPTEHKLSLVHRNHNRLVSPMRELERDDIPSSLSAAKPLVVVGRGRVGGSIAKAAEAAGIVVRLVSRDESAEGAGGVLLCVPDDAIAEVCGRLANASPPAGGPAERRHPPEPPRAGPLARLVDLLPPPAADFRRRRNGGGRHARR